MGKSKRAIDATADKALTPPADLTDFEVVARIEKGEGSGLWKTTLPNNELLLVELPAHLRSILWLKRGGFVVVDKSTFQTRQSKVQGEIVNVVRDEKEWRKQPYWPKEFAKEAAPDAAPDGELSVIGQLPPSDESD